MTAASPHEPPATTPLVVALAAAAGLAAFVASLSLGHDAHLWHFDAKGHLLVARRVLDSLTPGWRQLGTIWLPLPHLVNVLPTQNDRLYRSALFASGLGWVAFVLGLAALGAAAQRATRDAWAGVVALAVVALNPGWLYLAATPMTEPLFLGLVGGLAYFLVRWLDESRRADLVRAATCSALVCLVRYEAWPLAALAMLLAAWHGRSRRTLLIGVGLGCALPIVGYGLHAWYASGIPFHAISSENLTQSKGDVAGAVALLVSGLRSGFGDALTLAGVVALALAAWRARRPSGLLERVTFVCCAPAVVTLTAYLAGHPEKARYPLLLAPAIALALAALSARQRWLQALVLSVAAGQVGTLPAPLPVLREAVRDRNDILERQDILAALRQAYTGGRLLVSFAALAPVAYETQLPVREMVHEGNQGIWEAALADPQRAVAWVLIAEGDALDVLRAARPLFPEGFVPVAHFGRVTLFRRVADLAPPRLARCRPPVGGQSGLD